jgi:hypothetical protein
MSDDLDENSSLNLNIYTSNSYLEFNYQSNNDLNLEKVGKIFQDKNLFNKNGETVPSQNQNNSENSIPKKNNDFELNQDKVQYSQDDFPYYDLNNIVILLEKVGIHNFTVDHFSKFNSNEIQKIIEEIDIILTGNNKKKLTSLTSYKCFLKKKRERNEENKNEKNDKGRPRKDKPLKNTEGIHDKFCYDNIIRKIKTKVINKIRNYLNKIFNLQLKDTDFKTSKNVIDLKSNRETVMNPISKFFKNKISKKNKNTKNEEYNKDIIEAIEKGNDSNKINLLNKSLHDYLDVITLKKENTDLKDFFVLEQIIEEIIKKDSKEDSLEQSIYIIRFVFLLFNYERFLYSKEPRKSSKKKKIELAM